MPDPTKGAAATGRLPVLLLPGLLAIASLAARAWRFHADGRLVGISHEAQVGLARAVGGPTRLDFVLGGVHPGWNKAPLHPLLAAAAGSLAPDPRTAAIGVTWVYAAGLVPLCALLAARLWGRDAAPGAALVAFALPFLAGDLREYGLFAALALAAASTLVGLRGPADRAAAAGAGLLLGAMVASRWDAALWALVLLGAQALRARGRAGVAGPAGLPLLALLALSTWASVQLLAYPESHFGQRLGERLEIVRSISASFSGQSGLEAAFSQVHGAPGGIVAAGQDADFLAGWWAGLPGYLHELLPLLIHPLAWPAWALALLGLGLLRPPGRLAAALLLASPLALSFMPAKPVYLIPTACTLALLAGRGWLVLPALLPRGARLALGATLLACAVPSFAGNRLDPAEAARLETLHRVSQALDQQVPAGAPLLAPEDLCVLRIARNPCTFLEGAPAGADEAAPTGAWRVEDRGGEGGHAAAETRGARGLGEGWVLWAPGG